MPLAPFLLHPMVVHFPIAFLLGGFGAHVAGSFTRERAWLRDAEAALLWIGTACLWLTLGLGLLAESTAPHVPAAWKILRDHKLFAFSSAFMFTGLSLWRWRWPLGRSLSAFSLMWALSAGLLMATSHHGARLVFEFGMGVRRSL